MIDEDQERRTMFASGRRGERMLYFEELEPLPS